MTGILGVVGWSDWVSYSQTTNNVKVRRHPFSEMSVAAESSKMYFIYSLSLKFPCICSVPGVHTCHVNFFYTEEHPSYNKVPQNGCFTMILIEAREESGNIPAIS